jgi:rhodanese-related sulfurtransferase
MSLHTSISPGELAELIGSPWAPTLIDVRTDREFSDDPRFVPASVRRDPGAIADWAPAVSGRPVVVISRSGGAHGHDVAAWLRDDEVGADMLEGGHEAWAKTGLPLIPEDKLPPRDARGRTVWVTRARPKVDRIACPWLIRRFVDPNAVFLFVPSTEVSAVAERYHAAPFDIDGAFWGHREERCSFDALVDELGLDTAALHRLALIVRAADTGRPDLAPEAPGLLAASLGLSRLYTNDLEQLEAGLALYDALYAWALDAARTPHSLKSADMGKSS